MIIYITKCPNNVSLEESGTLFYTRGLSPFDPPKYKVIDKQLFFISVVKYGIEFVEMDAAGLRRKDAHNF